MTLKYIKKKYSIGTFSRDSMTLGGSALISIQNQQYEHHVNNDAPRLSQNYQVGCEIQCHDDLCVTRREFMGSRAPGKVWGVWGWGGRNGGREVWMSWEVWQ